MEIRDIKKSTIVCVLVGIILPFIVCFAVASEFKNTSSRDFINSKPVGNNDYIYDKADILSDIIESTGRYLEILKKEYNAPFLFCRQNDGWQFNIVHQRKYVRMGINPHWGIERSSHPYGDLLARCPFWMNQDIPLEGDDIYRIEDDRRLAQKIRNLESAYEDNPEDFKTVMQLGKLYTITSLSAKKRVAFLKKARNLNPGDPEPQKYLGIAHLDAFYQYESAIKEMSAYTEQRPDDVFGHNYLGYLYLCVQKYGKAISELNRAIELRPDNCYAFAKLSRTYTGLYLKSAAFDPRRPAYRKKAVEMFAKASATATPEPRRIKWLERYLVKSEILKSE